MSLQICTDTSEAIVLEGSLGLYLKPASKIKISVQLPKLKAPGQTISSWQVMEKLKAAIRPDQFLFLKALKITSAVIKLEGELETRAASERALARLKAAGCLKLNGFTEWLQIRAAHSTCIGPTRHDWDAFFRDARGVDEMKPGERPDTVYFQDLPVRWFAEATQPLKPSERLLQKAFATFGRIRRLEIPSSTKAEQTFGKTSSLHTDQLFEAYIQYEEYVEFATAMNTLRGKKLLYKDPSGKMYSAEIKVDFDKTNHLSDKSIRKRAAEAKKETATDPPANKEQIAGTQQENVDIPSKHSLTVQKNDILFYKQKAEAEGKLLMKELLHRAEITERKREKQRKVEKDKASLKQHQLTRQKELEEMKRLEKKNQEKLLLQERILKEKLLRNLKAKEQEKNMERERLRRKLAGRKILKSVLANTSCKNLSKG